ncbi:MAG: FlgD ig protein [Ignavibacteria bacterium]|nr:FlgD ig protein [Ignavibacteria bacterium]
MKKYLLLIAVAIGLLMWSTSGFAKGDGKKGKDEILRKAKMFEANPFINLTSFPYPFTEIGNSIGNAAVSTGYYFVDSDDEAPDYWRPIPEIIDTSTEQGLWKDIAVGPRVGPSSGLKQFWTDASKGDSSEGWRFFRNPAVPITSTIPADSSYFSMPGENSDIFATDSTDNAFAGPIPLRFGFYFNGLRYDSFYVSTNGIIALTNRRYTYNTDGTRLIMPGAANCYDINSNDWFQRGRSGDGLSDPTLDDYGYTYSVCGGNPASTTGGIRNNGGGLTGLPYQAAVIAPFYGSMHLSQYWESQKRNDNFGRVKYKRSFSSDKLIIYIMNIAPSGGMNTPYGAYTANKNLRRGESNYISATAQVTLNKSDSSVKIVYELFDGVAVVSGRGVPAQTIFRYNSTVGVRGFARHVNYGQAAGPTYPWAAQYEQATHYFSNYAEPTVSYPHNYLAIKFKQWKNTVRVVDIQYRVRKADPNASLAFSEQVKTTEVNNYELLAGEERIGAIQPVAILQNLTNNIQGPTAINYQPQQIIFRSRFRIVNLANDKIVYNRLVQIDSSCLALPDSLSAQCTGDPDVKVRYSIVSKAAGNYTATPSAFPGTNRLNGIPPYGFVQVYFPPFEPNEFVDNHIGRMRAFIIADPTNPQTGEGYGDEWPFDDTTSVQVFVMKRLTEFTDDVREYHIIERIPMPSVKKWVNIESDIADGEEVSFYPLPPRGEYTAANNLNYSLRSPVIRMNRLTLARTEPSPTPGGDQIRSFPVDMRLKYNAVISVSFQRTSKQDDWPRGWADQQLIGPEPRTFVNGDLLSQFGRTYGGGSYAVTAAASYTPDMIEVELAAPSPDGVQYITNIPAARWRIHPRRKGAAAETKVPAYRLFGSNGYQMGFLESDKDSALADLDATNNRPNGFRARIYDDGIDYFYQKGFIAIPDTFIRATKEGAKNFRFRIAVKAQNDKKCATCIPDDDDIFYVDNVRILRPQEITDIELSAVRIIWPYTQAPASQATKIPVICKLSNNTGLNANVFWIRVSITRQGDSKPIYCRYEPIPNMPGNYEFEQSMPSWNARQSGPGQYRMKANLEHGRGIYDIEPTNDSTYTTVRIRFGDVFSYDPPDNATNDVPDLAFTGVAGKGLNLFGFAVGGNGSIYGPSGGYDEVNWGSGWVGGSGSGQVAVKFELVNTDTIYGYQAFWGTLNQAMDDIALAIYDDQGGVQPNQPKAGSVLYRQRGLDAIRNEPFWNEYVTYLYPKNQPLVLPAGTYWAVIAQLGETGMELGASKSRMGMRTTNIYVPPPVTAVSPVGGSGYSLVIEKNFRRISSQGGNLINNNFFAFENTRGSGTWYHFMPSSGNPAYSHLNHYGTTPLDGLTQTLSRGSWIPLFRPYLKTRAYSTSPVYQECDSIPVRLVDFDALVRNSGIELYWETAQEQNNYGFYIERITSGSEDNWKTIGFVKGVGNSKVPTSYSYFDNKVTLNGTYTYRLRQIDLDGSQSCPSKEITRTFDKATSLTLNQNQPNPFNNSTSIGFNLPTSCNAKLEVLDIYGNVIKTLVNNELSATFHSYPWDGTDMNGMQVTSGTYIYKLTAGNETASAKMTFIR